MGRRSVVAAVSMFVHAIVLLVALTADLWRPTSDWPTPHSALAFTGEISPPIQLPDIALKPARSRNAASTTSESASQQVDFAPIAAPDSVAPDTEHEITLDSRPGPGVDLAVPDGGFARAPVPGPPPPDAQIVQAPIRLHSGIRPPQRTTNVTPTYPAAARSAHIEGVVIIEATIDDHGNVVRTQLLRSIPLLDDAALAAVRQWKFSPTLLNSVAVPIVMTVAVNFTLAP